MPVGLSVNMLCAVRDVLCVCIGMFGLLQPLVGCRAVTARGEVEFLSHSFLISALDGGECSASRPGRFTPA